MSSDPLKQGNPQYSQLVLWVPTNFSARVSSEDLAHEASYDRLLCRGQEGAQFRGHRQSHVKFVGSPRDNAVHSQKKSL